MNNRNTTRCPKCRLSNIYKRVRGAAIKSAKIKAARSSKANARSDINMKTYICRSCHHEFDVPFFGTKDDVKEKKNGLTKEPLDQPKNQESLTKESVDRQNGSCWPKAGHCAKAIKAGKQTDINNDEKTIICN